MKTTEWLIIISILFLWTLFDFLKNYQKGYKKVDFLTILGTIITVILTLVALTNQGYFFLKGSYGTLLFAIPVIIFQYFIVKQLPQKKRKKEVVIRSIVAWFSMFTLLFLI